MSAQKKKVIKQNTAQRIKNSIQGIGTSIKASSQQYLARRPHRSFRRTKRRDFARSLTLPGYWQFTISVLKVLSSHRRTFLLLALVYAVLTAFLVGIASQDTYTSLTDTIRQAGNDVFDGDWSALSKAGLLFLSAATGELTSGLTDVQQVYTGIIGLMTWLTTVWLLRNILAGRKVKIRDGLYNSSAPLLSTLLVCAVLIVQLLPIAIALIGYAAAVSSGILSGGVEAMLFWAAASLLILLSLYWITSTFIALVIITLPGMYPSRALKTAGDLVIGRRIRILLRILWLVGTIAVVWTAFIILVILLDMWIKGLWPAIEWVPIVPFSLLAIGALSVIWAASYIYLLYRRIVADDAAPA